MAFGIDPDVQMQKPIAARQALVGFFVGKRRVDAMHHEDTKPRPKPKGKKT